MSGASIRQIVNDCSVEGEQPHQLLVSDFCTDVSININGNALENVRLLSFGVELLFQLGHTCGPPTMIRGRATGCDAILHLMACRRCDVMHGRLADCRVCDWVGLILERFLAGEGLDLSF